MRTTVDALCARQALLLGWLVHSEIEISDNLGKTGSDTQDLQLCFGCYVQSTLAIGARAAAASS